MCVNLVLQETLSIWYSFLFLIKLLHFPLILFEISKEMAKNSLKYVYYISITSF